MNVAVIGSGVGGARVARDLALGGCKVNLFDMKPTIGRPIACTGIVSKNFAKHVDFLDDILVNTVDGAEFYSANEQFELKTGKTQAYVVQRDELDVKLFQEAQDAGVACHMKHRFMSNDSNSVTVEHNGTMKRFDADIVIGADGPLSSVAKANELWQGRTFLHGIQYRITGKFDKSFVSLFLGSVCPGFFAWVVPESAKTARVGVAARSGAKEHYRAFEDRLRKQFSVTQLEVQSGLIPEYKKIKLQSKNVYLLGDAGLQVKNTTGGGIVMSLRAAELLSKSILEGKNYEKLINKNLTKELFYHRLIRKMFNKFDDKKYDLLLRIMNRERNRNVLAEYGDMDYPSKFLMRLVLREPRFLRLLF